MARQQWNIVSPEEAKFHALYGIKGWLALFVVVLVFSFLGPIGSINYAAQNAGLSLIQLLSIEHPATTVLKVTIVINLIAFVIIMWLLVIKHEAFRLVTTGVIIAKILLTLLLGVMTPDKTMGSALAIDLITITFWGTVWIIYLNLSKRVRVTFEHSVLIEGK